MSMYTVKGETMTNIANAIRTKLKTTNTYLPSEMPDAIKSIEGGGGGGDDPKPLDPEQVYIETRPADWMPVPDAADNEVYLLWMFPDFTEDSLEFLSGGSGRKIEFGMLENGVFKANASLTETVSTSPYTKTVSYLDFPNNPRTNDGMIQVLCKFSFTSSGYMRTNYNLSDSLLKFPIYEVNANYKSAGQSYRDFYQARKLRYVKYKTSNTSTSTPFYNCDNLICVREFIDPSKVFWHASASQLYYGCYALKAIPKLDTSTCTNFEGMFYSCRSLEAIPDFDYSSATSTKNMFYGCSSLKKAPLENMPNVTNAQYMYSGCSSLKEVNISLPKAITPSYLLQSCSTLEKATVNISNAATDVRYMFGSCYNLKEVAGNMDTSNATRMDSMFSSCYALRKLPELNTSKCTSFNAMFSSCYSISVLPDYDYSSITSTSSMSSAFTSSRITKAHLNYPIACSTLPTTIYLTDITFDNTKTWSDNVTLTFTSCRMQKASLVRLLESLPTMTATGTVNLKGNPGATQLTDTEKAIATSKGWTLQTA